MIKESWNKCLEGAEWKMATGPAMFETIHALSQTRWLNHVHVWLSHWGQQRGKETRRNRQEHKDVDSIIHNDDIKHIHTNRYSEQRRVVKKLENMPWWPTRTIVVCSCGPRIIWPTRRMIGTADWKRERGMWGGDVCEGETYVRGRRMWGEKMRWDIRHMNENSKRNTATNKRTRNICFTPQKEWRKNKHSKVYKFKKKNWFHRNNTSVGDDKKKTRTL